MPTVFTQIINGQLPARFVYTDDVAVAFLSIAPLTEGHTLVVPRAEVDQWTDAGEPLLHHCLSVARRIGNAAKQAYGAPRAGLVIAGMEVPHMHIHVFPTWTLEEFDFTRAKQASDAELDQAAARLHTALAASPSPDERDE